jgi:hypothetical protein
VLFLHRELSAETTTLTMQQDSSFEVSTGWDQVRRSKRASLPQMARPDGEEVIHGTVMNHGKTRTIAAIHCWEGIARSFSVTRELGRKFCMLLIWLWVHLCRIKPNLVPE